MSSTILLLLLMAILRQTNGQESCERIKATGTPCCKGPKELSCAFTNPSELKAGDKCNCKPTDKPKIFSVKCVYAGLSPESTNGRTSIPCHAYFKQCLPPAAHQETPEINCFYGYPPQAQLLHRQEEGYCDYQVVVNGKAVLPSDETFYDIYFTCWLYRCGNRFEKTKWTTDKSGKVQWCFPPILPGDPKAPEYCPKYVHNATVTIYKANAFNNATTKFEEMIPGCVLPPICNANGKIDKTQYMLPWYKGKADEKHCEVLCPKEGPNNGKIDQGKGDEESNRCRILPTCGNEEMYNRFQISNYTTNCRPWCDTNLFSLEKNHSKSRCNVVPLCAMDNGKFTDLPEEPYSENNPYGSKLRCEKPACKESEKPETHRCMVPTEDSQINKAGFPYLAVFLGVGGFVVLAAVVGVLVYIFYFRRRKIAAEAAAAEELEMRETEAKVKALKEQEDKPNKIAERKKKEGEAVAAEIYEKMRELEQAADNGKLENKNAEKEKKSEKEKKDASNKDKPPTVKGGAAEKPPSRLPAVEKDGGNYEMMGPGVSSLPPPPPSTEQAKKKTDA